MIEIIKFIFFFIISYLILMQIFVYSTYHKYFWKIIPVLAIYSGLVGYLLFYFGFHGGFLWQIVLSIVFLILNAKKQNRKFNELINVSNDIEKTKLLAKSVLNTKKYFWISVMTYLIIFSLTYIFCINIIKIE